MVRILCYWWDVDDIPIDFTLGFIWKDMKFWVNIFCFSGVFHGDRDKVPSCSENATSIPIFQANLPVSRTPRGSRMQLLQGLPLRSPMCVCVEERYSCHSNRVSPRHYVHWLCSVAIWKLDYLSEHLHTDVVCMYVYVKGVVETNFQ